MSDLRDQITLSLDYAKRVVNGLQESLKMLDEPEPLPEGVERDADEPDWFVISLPSMRYEPESLLSPLHRNDIARIAELHRILTERGE